MDASIVCRICFDSSGAITSLASTGVDGISLADMLRRCVRLEINPDDGLPYLCCTRCKRDLIVAYKLVTRCYQSDAKFREMMLEAEPEAGSAMDEGTVPLMELKTEVPFEEPAFSKPLFQGSNLDIATKVKVEETEEIIESAKAEDAFSKDMKKLGNSQDTDILPLYDVDVNPNIKIETHNDEATVVKLENTDDFDEDENLEDDVSDVDQNPEDNEDDEGVVKKRKKIPQQCCVCRIELNTMEEILNHAKTIHLTKPCTNAEQIETNPFECNLCFKRFISENSLIQHQHRLLIRDTFECDDCGKTFMSDSNLLQHQATHQKERDSNSRPKYKRPRCCVCLTQFVSDDHLKLHAMKNHPRLVDPVTESSSKQFTCDLCQRQYGNIFYLREHHAKLYQKADHQCTICRRSFRVKKALEEHERSHRRQKRSYQCGTCSKTFFKQDLYRKHVEAHSLLKVQFECDVCEKRFWNKETAIHHVKQHHPVRCTICSAVFAGKKELRYHMQEMHAVGRPNRCHLCGLTFSLPQSLRSHVVRSHKVEYQQKLRQVVEKKVEVSVKCYGSRKTKDVIKTESVKDE